MTITTLTLVLIFFYLIIVKGITILAHRNSLPLVDDYFLAGRKVPSSILMCTIIATMVNAIALTAVPALIYKGGILFLQMWVVVCVAPLLFYIFGPKLVSVGINHGYMTQGKLFGDIYQSNYIKWLVAIIGIASIFPFMTTQLIAAGKIFSSTTGGFISYELGILICVVSIGIYLIFGGSRAVIWTDAFQGLFFFLLLLISAALFTFWAGGPNKITSNLILAIPEKLSFNKNNFPIFIDNILSWPFAFFLWPQLFQRVFMAPSPDTVKKATQYTFICFAVIMFCIMTMGMAATATLYRSLEDPTQLISEMYRTYAPLGGAFLVVTVLATGMSTVDSMLLTLSSIVLCDICPNRDDMQKSEQKRFNWARHISLFFLVIVSFAALSEELQSAMIPLVGLGASFATLLLWPLICSYLQNKPSANEILTLLIIGFVAINLEQFTPLGSYTPFGAGTIGFVSCAFCSGVRSCQIWCMSDFH